MKIAVLSLSGNVGKTTIARHLLAPRFGCSVVSIESINADGAEDIHIRGKQFGQMIKNLALLDDAIIDVGSSNIEDFLSRMEEYCESHEDFDYFIIPTIGKNKQMRDTISSIQSLIEMGVSHSKIKIIFNMVEKTDQIETVFAPLFHFADSIQLKINSEAVIYVNELYEQLKVSEQSILDILTDPTDLKILSNQAENERDKLQISQRIQIRRLAVGVNRELNRVFQKLEF